MKKRKANRFLATLLGFILLVSNSTLFASINVNNFDRTSNKSDGLLTLEECVSRALEANYSVVISNNNLEIAKNNVNLEPFLPIVSASSRFSDNRLEQRSYTTQGNIDKSSNRGTSAINGL